MNNIQWLSIMCKEQSKNTRGAETEQCNIVHVYTQGIHKPTWMKKKQYENVNITKLSIQWKMNKNENTK